MERRQRRRNAKTQLEPGRDVQNNADKGDHDRDQRIFLQLLPDRRAYFRRGIHDKFIVRELLREHGHHPFSRLFLDRGRGFNAHEQLVVLPKFLQFRIAQPVGLQGFPRFLDPDGLVELQLHGSSAGKVDPEIGRSARDLDQRNQTEEHHDTREEKGNFSLTHEIEVCFPQNL